jgi:hypothetical protein
MMEKMVKHPTFQQSRTTPYNYQEREQREKKISG